MIRDAIRISRIHLERLYKAAEEIRELGNLEYCLLRGEVATNSDFMWPPIPK